jgi:hypothetical protein
MASWRDMLDLARPGDETGAVPDGVLVRLLRLLADTKRPVMMLEVLRPMWRDGRVIPPELMDIELYNGGRSIITSWLPAFLLSLRSRRRSEGEAWDFLQPLCRAGSSVSLRCFAPLESITNGNQLGQVV